MQALKKELENLKFKVSQAETIAMAASQKFEDESRKLKELQAQFKAADDIRQEAYEELRNLKKGLYEKVCNHIQVLNLKTVIICSPFEDPILSSPASCW